MFKHILLPTDGSKLSAKAVQRGIDIAKKTKARVTVLHVVPEFKLMVDEGITMLSPALKKRFEDEGRQRAQKMLDAVAGSAPKRFSTIGVSAPEMPLIAQLAAIATATITASARGFSSAPAVMYIAAPVRMPTTMPLSSPSAASLATTPTGDLPASSPSVMPRSVTARAWQPVLPD